MLLYFPIYLVIIYMLKKIILQKSQRSFRDIAKRKKTREQELAKNKLKFLTDVLSELRTTLTIIYENLKLESEGGKNKGRIIFRNIQSEVNRMSEMVNDLSLLARPVADTILWTGNLSLNTKTYEVKRGGKIICLPEKLFALLQYLLTKKDKIVSKGEIIPHLWGNRPVKSNALEVLVRRLRKSIDRNYEEKLITTIHGVGYKIRSI